MIADFITRLFVPRTSQISPDPTGETAFADFSCGSSNVNVLGMEISVNREFRERFVSNEKTDYGPSPYAANIPCMARQNNNFRTALWTGTCLQMTLMCIPPAGEIGLEVHTDTDQFIRIEQGNAVVVMGCQKEQTDYRQKLCCGDGVFVPAGVWHNIINIGNCPLKISSIYAPPHHQRGTVHRTKSDAEREGY